YLCVSHGMRARACGSRPRVPRCRCTHPTGSMHGSSWIRARVHLSRARMHASLARMLSEGSADGGGCVDPSRVRSGGVRRVRFRENSRKAGDPAASATRGWRERHRCMGPGSTRLGVDRTDQKGGATGQMATGKGKGMVVVQVEQLIARTKKHL